MTGHNKQTDLNVFERPVSIFGVYSVRNILHHKNVYALNDQARPAQNVLAQKQSSA